MAYYMKYYKSEKTGHKDKYKNTVQNIYLQLSTVSILNSQSQPIFFRKEVQIKLSVDNVSGIIRSLNFSLYTSKEVSNQIPHR